MLLGVIVVSMAGEENSLLVTVIPEMGSRHPERFPWVAVDRKYYQSVAIVVLVILQIRRDRPEVARNDYFDPRV